MLENLRERMRTKQAYRNAPVTYEMLGIRDDEKGVKWLRRNFGHMSMQAMATIYSEVGILIGIIIMSVMSGHFEDTPNALIIVSAMGVFVLWTVRRDGKKVAN